MGPQHLRPVQLLCLLWAITFLPRLLCYEAVASLFRGVTFSNWRWLLLRSMVCKQREGCEETLVYIETGTHKGVLGFKGCSSASSYSPQVSYLVSPPGVSIASYSHVCRTYLCNNLTTLQPFVRLKATDSKSVVYSSHNCPSCVGEHSRECLPVFVVLESCPMNAFACYSATIKFQAGSLNTTFLLMGCTNAYRSFLAKFHHIGSIRVTEELNIVEKSWLIGAGHSSLGSFWSVLLGFLLIFKH
uniref:LY6/PLAUR domain containing 4 n=1 Tax=Cavia porcellus TaxID=10141 RepID=H0UX32_CAVPO